MTNFFLVPEIGIPIIADYIKDTLEDPIFINIPSPCEIIDSLLDNNPDRGSACDEY